MAIDRTVQREILEILREAYPLRGNVLKRFDPVREEEVIANLVYLDQHGLIESGITIGADQHYSYSLSKITAAGIDFLEDDGGVSAILKTVTVRLHADTIRDLLAKKVDEADLSDEEKSTLRKAVKELPATALAAGAGDLMKMGLDHAPNAIALIRAWVGM